MGRVGRVVLGVEGAGSVRGSYLSHDLWASFPVNEDQKQFAAIIVLVEESRSTGPYQMILINVPM